MTEPPNYGKSPPLTKDELATERALSHLDEFADIWAKEVGLDGMCARISLTPDAETRFAALVRQAFVEGAYRHIIDCRDGLQREPVASAPYTPGPWTACFSVLKGEPYDFHVAASLHGSSLPVCELRQSIDMLDPHGHDRPYWPPSILEANARLIAAAPNLFEAAEKAIYAIDNILTAHEGQSEHAELMAAFVALEAALYKAEGKPK